MVVSAFPLTQIILQANSPSSPGSDTTTTPGAANAGMDGTLAGPAGVPEAYPGVLDLPGSLGGTSSRPAGSQVVESTGSTLLDQVLHSAKLMGLDAKLPDLPVDQLASVDPLRPALLAWIAATHSDVPADELSTQLQRADALPQPLQRDLALLVLSAVQAIALQNDALAKLTPEQQAWIRANPDVATRLARGEDDAQTRALAAMAGLVDGAKSVEASLLLLEAVEATRGSIESDAGVKQMKELAGSANVDPQTAQVLALLAQASSKTSDQDKVLFAAQLVALTAHVAPPVKPAKASVPDALQALLAATGQVPDASALKTSLDTLALFPADLQDAVGSTLAAEANAVNAANPLKTGGDSQPEALVKVLAATAYALPTLEKYHLYWRDAPAALRVGQWSPAARAGWAVEHAALLTSANGDPVDVARAVGLMRGAALVDATVPERTLLEAYIAIESEKGLHVADAARAQVSDAASKLDPTVARAAAHLLSGAAESARLQREAFARLTPDERALTMQPLDTSALYTKTDITADDLALLQRLSVIQEKVDLNKLAAAEVVAVRATMEARQMLLPTLHAQSESVRGYSLWDALAKLLPWQSARAQSGGCVPLNTVGDTTGLAFGSVPIVTNDCDQDILLTINSGIGLCFISGTPTPGCPQGRAEMTKEVLVITGMGTSHVRPQTVTRVVSAPECFQDTTGVTCTGGQFAPTPAFGAATVLLDLGGSHTYERPVAVTTPFNDISVSIQLDMGGSDTYLDPTALYDAKLPLYLPCGEYGVNEGACFHSGDSYIPVFTGIGTGFGHPSQGSALAGGVALLVDSDGAESYQAPSLSQGYGQWGLGMLVDLGTTRDTYAAREWSQGAAGRDMGLGAGVLLDLTGDDSYRALSGEGYGYGGVILDLGGQDAYSTDTRPQGVPLVHLDIIPGGDVTALDARKNDVAWLDGPASLNTGIGLDVGAVSLNPNAGDSDSDGYSDFVEFVLGTDAHDPQSTPLVTHDDGVLDRERLLAQDSDGDTFPDFVERALSTDPQSKASYPAGFPVGPTFTVPGVGQVSAGSFSGSASNTPAAQDKIVDLRLPLQDAGRVDYGCVGTMQGNDTDPNVGFVVTAIVGSSGSSSNVPQGPCVLATYATGAPGQGQASVPLVSPSGTNRNGDTSFANFTFQIPAGILAIGDAVTTAYDEDYFLVIDIGGDDTFHDHAGGALAVMTRPSGESKQDGNPQSAGGGGSGAARFNENRNVTFFAPSLVLNVDLGAVQNVSAAGVDSGARVSTPDGTYGYDRYLKPTRGSINFTQGSMEGVLLDTAGNDKYDAGSASQGALGGILLDLAGDDTYAAENLAQGAGLASPYATGQPGTTEAAGDTVNRDTALGDPTCDPSKGCTSDAGERTSAPGLLLDLGAGTDRYAAGWDSQGFARGFPGQNAATSFGILLDDGGNDRYDTATKRGDGTQGAGTIGGVGILVDLKGDDMYAAGSVTSQGAPVSASYGAACDPCTDQPGAGLLVDAQGNDTYRYVDRFGVHDERTTARKDQLTITRSDLRGSSTGSANAQPGIHLDTDTDDPNTVVNSVLGSGTKNATSAQDTSTITETQRFYVDLPSARLAIGSPDDTPYTRQYAFVVDLGGVNTYRMNAGGFVPDVAAESAGTNGAIGGNTYKPLASAFPVSFVLDAGATGSRYEANTTAAPGAGALAQGAGYFGVGVLVDLGGNDTFTVLPERVTSYASSWMPLAPTIDGTVGTREWAGIGSIDTRLVGMNDSRYAEPATIRIANDDQYVYVAISSRTSSDLWADSSLRDLLTLDLLAEPSQTDQSVGDVWDRHTDTTLLDESRVVLRGDANGPHCAVLKDASGNSMSDQHGGSSTSATDISVSRDLSDDTTFGCGIERDGTFTIEIKKPLRALYPKDSSDLDVPYGPFGFDPSTLHVRAELYEAAAHDRFAWPAGTARADGEAGYPTGATLHEEVADWAPVGLATKGHDGVARLVTRTPALAQGVGLGGVGILAMLGQSDADSAVLTASDRAQGYGLYGGLGLVLDAGGSDSYVANTLAQGASGPQGLGIMLELGGNDDYANHGKSLGYAGTGQNAALFADLGGFDAYHTPVLGASESQTGRSARNESVAPESGAATDGRGETGQPVPVVADPIEMWGGSGANTNGRGLDMLSLDQRSTLTMDTLFHAADTTLDFKQPSKSGKCDSSDGFGNGEGGLPLLGQRGAQTGLVCLVAKTVNVGQVQGQSSQGTISVDSVEFLMSAGDGVWTRLATVRDSLEPADASTRTFLTPYNVSFLQDGVKTVFAQATVRFTPNDPTKPVILVHAKPTPTAAAYRRVLVDNVAHDAVCTLPKLDPPVEFGNDPCSATTTPGFFSPKAVDSPSDNYLKVLWAASHDAREDTTAIYDRWTTGGRPADWTIPADHANVPCPDASVGMCNVIPLWLRSDGAGLGGQDDVWSTQPPWQDRSSASTIPITIRPEQQNDQPYSHVTDKITAPLAITKADGFHVRLYNRTPVIFGGSFTTTVQVQLLDGSGTEITDQNGQKVFVANQPLTSPRLDELDPSSVQGDPTGLLGTVFDAFHTQDATWETAGGLADTVFALAAGDLKDPIVEACTVNAAGLCATLNGDPNVNGQNHVCALAPVGPVISGNFPCGEKSVHNTVGPTFSDTVYPVVAGQANKKETLDELGRAGKRVLNWNDLYVTLSELPPQRADAKCRLVPDDAAHPKVITVQPSATNTLGCKLKFELLVKNNDGVLPKLFADVDGLTLGATLEDAECRGNVHTPPNPAVTESEDAHQAGLCQYGNMQGFGNQTTNATGQDPHACSTPPPDGAPADPRSGERTVCNFYNTTPIIRNDGPLHGPLAGLDANHQNVPFPISSFRFGEPANPSVFEIRSPTHPTTRATLRVYPANPDGTPASDVAVGQLFPRPGQSSLIEGDVFGGETSAFHVSADGVHPGACSVIKDDCHTDYYVSDDPLALRYTQRQLAFTGTLPTGEELDDGLYVLNLTVADTTPASDGSAPKEAYDLQTFLLDKTPPSTRITTGSGPDGRYVGAALLASGGIPITWTVPDGDASGVKQVAVFKHVGSDGLEFPGSWERIFQGTRRDFQDIKSSSTINDYHYIIVGEDNAGNVEGQDTIKAAVRTLTTYLADPVNVEKPSDLEWAIYNATLAQDHLKAGQLVKQANLDWKDLIVDAARPASYGVPSITGAGVAQASLSAGVNALYVRGGAPFDARICGADADVGVSHETGVVFVFDYVDPATGNVTSWPDPSNKANVIPYATYVGTCPSGGDEFEYKDWGLVNANSRAVKDAKLARDSDIISSATAAFAATDVGKPVVGPGLSSNATILEIINASAARISWPPSANATNATVTIGFPDGIWAVSADITDLAGNRDQVSIATIILDSKAPTVALQAPVYPSGQQAVKPGDRVSLRLAASDAFGVNTTGIQIDASGISTDGVVTTRATRVNGVLYQEATVKIDKISRDDLYLVPVSVPDQAGNVWRGAFGVIVDNSRFTMVPGSVGVQNASYHSVVVHWTTTSNTTSMVRYGTSPLELKSRTPIESALVKDHTVKIDGLDASTRYYFRAVSDTAGGYENESDTIDALTTTALYLAPQAPLAGAKVSGDVPVLFTGGLHDSTAPVSYVLEAQGAADEPWGFVTTLTESGSDHALHFNSTHYLDGPAYRLRITATAGKDVLTSEIGPFLSDNTPPGLEIVAPLVATNDTTPKILAIATDELSGITSNGSATLTIDGDAANGLAVDVSGGTARITYDVPTPLLAGPHTLALTIRDQAGNVASQTWKVNVDGQPPVLTVNKVTYAPGPSAAKLGGTVTINLTATDASGVASIVADTAAIADGTTRLDHVAGTTYWVGTFKVTSVERELLAHVPLTAVDLAQNARATTVDVTIDNVKPTASDVRAGNITQVSALLTTDASEPVRLLVTATAPGVPDVTAATTDLVERPILQLTGLYPSRTYAFHAHVVDRAGNEIELGGAFPMALDVQPPTQVGALKVVDLQNGTLRLSWPAAADDVAIAHYTILRASGDGVLRPIAEVAGTTTQYDDVGLPLETTFTYQVAAVDYGGNQGEASQALRASATAVPRLTVGVVTPTVGSTATVFRYVVTYSSPGGVKPAYVRVLLDGAAQDMKSLGNGTYMYETRLAPHTRDHPHSYSFEASDGRYTVKFPVDGSTIRGPLVSADAGAADAASGVGFAQRVPMVGMLGTAAAILAGAAAVLVLRRRGSK